MKTYCRNMTNYFIGFYDYAKEKLDPFFNEIKQRGEARSREESSGDQEGFSARIKTTIDKVIAEMKFAKKEELDALKARIDALEENLKQK